MEQLPEIIYQLKLIGMSTYEARAYAALLANQPVNGYDLARLSGIPTSKIYETLLKLVTKGAAQASASQPTLYRAAPPDQLISEVRQRTEESLLFLDKVLPGLVAETPTGVIWRLKGSPAIKDQLLKIVSEARLEIFLSVWPTESGDLVEPLALAEERGVLVWVASFGPSPIKGPEVHDLFSCGASSKARLGKRLMAVVADDRKVLIAEFLPGAESAGTLADDSSLALVTKEYIIHDLVNHALILEIGYERFKELRTKHHLLAGLLGPG